jgi:methionyl-tRNA formyltransferase
VVAAYGKILSKDILDLPPLGCINIHASLLPRFRGAAPIQHAIISGDSHTGVTMMYMSAGMDEGDIISKKATPIDRKTAGELFKELALMGGDLLIETLEQIVDGSAKSFPQNHSLATYAPKITKEDSRLDFNRKAIEIHRLIRAMSPLPGAYTNYQEKTMKIFDGQVVKSNSLLPPGTIKHVDDSGILVATGEDDILIKQIRMPGKQTMDVSEYIKGNKIEIGNVLG